MVSEMSLWERFKGGFITKSAMLDTLNKMVFRENNIDGHTRVSLAEMHELQAGSPLRADLRASKLDSDIHSILGGRKAIMEEWGTFLINLRIQDRLINESESVSTARIEELMEKFVGGVWTGSLDERFELINLTVRSKEVDVFRDLEDVSKLADALNYQMEKLGNPDLLRVAKDSTGNTLLNKMGNPLYEGKFVEASEIYHKHLEDSLFSLYDAGLITTQSYNRIVRGTSFYMPFYVIKYFNRNPADTFQKYITGIRDDFRIIPPMDAARFKIYVSQLRADRNIFMQKLEDYRRDFDPGGKFIMKVDDLDAVPVDREEVKFYEDGIAKYLVFDREVARLLKDFDPVSATQLTP